jgi:hypothetical protein
MSDSKGKLIQFFRDTNPVGSEKAEEFAGHFHLKQFAKNDFFFRKAGYPMNISTWKKDAYVLSLITGFNP